MNQIVKNETLLGKFMTLMGQLQVHPELKISICEDYEWVEVRGDDILIWLVTPQHLENHWEVVFIETTNNDEDYRYGYHYGWTYEGGGAQFGTYDDLMDTNRCENCGWPTGNCQCETYLNKQIRK
tara:strand:+ start:1106 stop:1480 length:375 start_codon:yes stop_codon:yes gene_type:complete